jgi:hypothetical protein
MEAFAKRLQSSGQIIDGIEQGLSGGFMSRKKAPEPEVHVHTPSKPKGTLKPIAGSMSDDWNNLIANQTARTLWHFESTDPEIKTQERFASIGALVGIAPRDECEGMIAAQMVACHHAAMECYRRAMIPKQTFEGRSENLNQASKLPRTYSTLLEALNRHRGKGQQKVTRARARPRRRSGHRRECGISGGGGIPAKSKDQPHAKQLTHAPDTQMPRADTTRDAVPIAGDEERPLQDARRPISWSTERK